jgi:DNA invertase Pin-like site-specific DNA recombinase
LIALAARSKHLIEVVNELMTRKIGLKSLNDPIDTTTHRAG